MQNNNSKVNTVLLVILVILAGFCAWKLADRDREVENDIDFTPMDDLQTIDIGEKDEAKPVVTQPTPTPVVTGNASDLVSSSVVAGQKVTGTMSWSGVLQGGYFFEGSTGVHITDANKNILRTTHITAVGDWMTAGPVTFTGTLDFTGLTKGPGYILIESIKGEDNALVKEQIFIPIVIQ